MPPPPRIFVLTLFFLLLPAIHVRAASITVNSSCSLADAITAANSDSNSHNTSCTAGSGADTITLTSNITLSAEPTAIASNITIEGNNRSISGNNTVRILRIDSGTVRINNLTLRNGRAATAWSSLYAGGAILNVGGTLTVSESHFINNVSPPDTNNCATTSDYGGAIAAFGSNRLTVLDSVFRGNRSTNQAAIAGGRNAPITVRRSSFTGHAVPDNFTATGCSPMVLNIGHGGEISNVTISGNSAVAIHVVDGETTTIRHSTIVNNKSPSATGAGGISQSTSGGAARARLYNNIIADNSNRNCGGAEAVSTWITANVNNLVKTRIVVDGEGNTQEFDDCGTTSSTITDDPRLASFRGSPGYRPLLHDSPAIDAANLAACNALPLVNGQRVDIRGVSRPAGTACDIGSYEGFLPPPSEDENGGGGDDDDDNGDPTPTPLPRPNCVFCPDLLVRGFQLSATHGLDSGVEFRRVDRGGIGVQSVLDEGFLDAVDIYGFVEQGVEVCFPGAGRLLLLDAATSPRMRVPLDAYAKDGRTCGATHRAGTMVLLAGPPPPVATAVAPQTISLNNCMVTTNYIVNFRESPGGARINFVDPWGAEVAGWLPYNVTLTALERTAYWFKVDYHGTRGWIHADYVTPHGVCG